MNKKLILESLLISALFVALMSTTVFAGYPGPDDDADYDYDIHGYGSYTYAYVIAEYGDPSKYNKEDYQGARDAGTGENDGYLYFTWFVDEEYLQGYTHLDEIFGYADDECTLVAAYVVSDFKKGAQEWTCEALACRQIY